MNENQHFDASDLSAVKRLLKSLDLKVSNDDENDEVSHQAFYNTFARPDKEGQFNEENRLKNTQKVITELLKKGQKIDLFWGSGKGETLIQLMVNGQDFVHKNSSTIEKVLQENLINQLELPHEHDFNQSKGQAKLELNVLGQIVLNGHSEEVYQVQEKLEQADLWESPSLPLDMLAHRFFENNLPFASKFEGSRRGFHAEIIQHSTPSIDFFFLPKLELSTEEIRLFSTLLLKKVDAMTLKRHDYDFSTIKYEPTLEINGQVTNEKIAILSLEVTYMVFEKRTQTATLFKK